MALLNVKWTAMALKSGAASASPIGCPSRTITVIEPRARRDNQRRDSGRCCAIPALKREAEPTVKTNAGVTASAEADPAATSAAEPAENQPAGARLPATYTTNNEAANASAIASTTASSPTQADANANATASANRNHPHASATAPQRATRVSTKMHANAMALITPQQTHMPTATTMITPARASMLPAPPEPDRPATYTPSGRARLRLRRRHAGTRECRQQPR